MPEYVTCEDCNRVLFKEHGPVCPECLEKRARAPKSKTPKDDE